MHEPVVVCVWARNPLMVDLTLTDVRLRCSLSPPADDPDAFADLTQTDSLLDKNPPPVESAKEARRQSVVFLSSPSHTTSLSCSFA